MTSVTGRKRLRARTRLYDLPRTEEEKYINDYNPAILTAWEGNMDIQYVGEESTLLNWYCTKYVTKSETSCGFRVLDVNNNDVNNNDVNNNDVNNNVVNNAKDDTIKSWRQRIWNFALRCLNMRECGAIEAVETLLGVPLYSTDPSTTIRWVDVNQVRSRKLKTRSEIEILDPESTDIFCPSIVDTYYPNRPNELETMCLYDFAKWYDVTKVKPKRESSKYF